MKPMSNHLNSSKISVLLFKPARLLSIVILSAAFWNNLVHAESVVTFVGDPWPPYVEGELGEDAKSGIAVEIVNEIFAQIENARARFPLIPWNRALREVEEGLQDGIGILLKTPEREQYMVYSEPMLVDLDLVWSTTEAGKQAFEWSVIDDFNGLRVGVVDGYSYGATIDQEIERGRLDVIKLQAVEQMFAMLANDRLDLVLATDSVGRAMSKKFPGAGIKAAKRATSSHIYYLAISKKSPAVDLIPEINRIIKQLKADGVIEQIVGSR